MTPWRGVFVTLALVGARLAVGLARGVPESLPAGRRITGGADGAMRATANPPAQPRVLVPVLTIGCRGPAVFAFVAGATFVLHDLLQLSPTMTASSTA
ncbi:hypothetical protein GTY65_39700 [Streptomyces sp. SID8379]|uniref:hypothetical protein n=1 Tax=unclassified Streptomyces TaxID=2593676 RepID=UPI00131A2085|nr:MULTISPECIES: hypothetical protein [unclassified Streptomyces]MYW70135.1 hypothetical protein [Streptomyces sp. SID8379]